MEPLGRAKAEKGSIRSQQLENSLLSPLSLLFRTLLDNFCLSFVGFAWALQGWLVVTHDMGWDVVLFATGGLSSSPLAHTSPHPSCLQFGFEPRTVAVGLGSVRFRPFGFGPSGFRYLRFRLWMRLLWMRLLQIRLYSVPATFRQRANGYVLMGTRILGIQAKNGSEWLGEWLRRLFGGS